jgi:hypothetical protein
MSPTLTYTRPYERMECLMQPIKSRHESRPTCCISWLDRAKVWLPWHNTLMYRTLVRVCVRLWHWLTWESMHIRLAWGHAPQGALYVYQEDRATNPEKADRMSCEPSIDWAWIWKQSLSSDVHLNRLFVHDNLTHARLPWRMHYMSARIFRIWRLWLWNSHGDQYRNSRVVVISGLTPRYRH